MISTESDLARDIAERLFIGDYLGARFQFTDPIVLGSLLNDLRSTEVRHSDPIRLAGLIARSIWTVNAVERKPNHRVWIVLRCYDPSLMAKLPLDLFCGALITGSLEITP